MSENKIRNFIVGAAVGVGCGVVLVKQHLKNIDKDGEVKENSKKLAEDTVELGKSVGNIAKRAYTKVCNKAEDISEEIKEKFKEKKDDMLKKEEKEEEKNSTEEQVCYTYQEEDDDEDDFIEFIDQD